MSLQSIVGSRSHLRKNHWPVMALITAVMFGVLMSSARLAPVRALGSCNTGQAYYHDISVGAAGFARSDKVVEVYLNLTPLLAAQGGSGAINLQSLCVDERAGGAVVANDVVFQFDKAANFNATTKARGTLAFLMSGATAANETRTYRLHFDTAAGFAAPTFTDHVGLTDGVAHKGYQSLRLVTADATYFYHKPGGGFATLLDKNNDDWIGWNSTAGSAGDYRGIPNMVHPTDGGYFHPGRNTASTTVLSDGPLKASFKSISSGGAWEVRWDVFPTYARMTLARKGTTNFWWLYEGTPGGLLELSVDRLTRSDGSSIKASGTWTTDIPGDEWLYVTDPNSGANGRSLYLIHHQTDTKVDGYSADTNGRMTIFGFGRSGNARSLNSLPQQFTFGLTDETTLAGVGHVVNGAYKPMILTGQNDPGDDPGEGPACVPQTYAVYASPKKAITVDGIKVFDEDVVKYDSATCKWSVAFDGSAAGLPAIANVDALAIAGDDIYLSFVAPTTVPGISGKVDDSDVVRYGAGQFWPYFDGSVYGLTTDAEDVDAIAFDQTGKLLVSTTGANAVPGLPNAQDEDLLRFDNGNWSIYFDGSHNAGLGVEDVVGADVGADGSIYLSMLDAFNAGGVKGNATNILLCTPSSLGYLNTSCAYAMFWRSTDFGLANFNAIDIE